MLCTALLLCARHQYRCPSNRKEQTGASLSTVAWWFQGSRGEEALSLQSLTWWPLQEAAPTPSLICGLFYELPLHLLPQFFPQKDRRLGVGRRIGSQRPKSSLLGQGGVGLPAGGGQWVSLESSRAKWGCPPCGGLRCGIGRRTSVQEGFQGGLVGGLGRGNSWGPLWRGKKQEEEVASPA